jgi:GcrA cell cycle regulator
MDTWTPERIDKLRELWPTHSAAEISALIGGGISRSAVIGKAHRLGIVDRDHPKKCFRPSGHRTRYRREPGHRPLPRVRLWYRRREPDPPRLRWSAPTPVSPGHPVTFLELMATTCRYPIGDPQDEDFHFCGNPSFQQMPYCEVHCRIAYKGRGPSRGHHNYSFLRM